MQTISKFVGWNMVYKEYIKYWNYSMILLKTLTIINGSWHIWNKILHHEILAPEKNYLSNEQLWYLETIEIYQTLDDSRQTKHKD